MRKDVFVINEVHLRLVGIIIGFPIVVSANHFCGGVGLAVDVHFLRRINNMQSIFRIKAQVEQRLFEPAVIDHGAIVADQQKVLILVKSRPFCHFADIVKRPAGCDDEFISGADISINGF